MECVWIVLEVLMMDVVSECCGSINGYICNGAILFECVCYIADGNRKVYKKAPKGNVCSSCLILWNKLLKFKRKL